MLANPKPAHPKTDRPRKKDRAEARSVFALEKPAPPSYCRKRKNFALPLIPLV